MDSQAPTVRPSLDFGSALIGCPGDTNFPWQFAPFSCEPRRFLWKAQCGFPLKNVAVCPICSAHRKKSQKKPLKVYENQKMYALNIERDLADGKGWVRESRIVLKGRVAIENFVSHVFDTSAGMMRLRVEFDNDLPLELRGNDRRKRWCFGKWP